MIYENNPSNESVQATHKPHIKVSPRNFNCALPPGAQKENNHNNNIKGPNPM